MKIIVKAAWFAFEFFGFTLGLSLFVPFLFAFRRLKPLGDALSKDGNLESFTLARYEAVRWPALFLGFILLAAAGVALIYRRATFISIAKAINWLIRMLGQLKQDFGLFWADLNPYLPRGWELAVLLVICSAALAGRLFFINQPIDYDEAYSFTEFAQHSFQQVISDYHVPNNHVFHTILMRVSFLLFGAAPWAIRMPVLLAGLALIPVAYLLAKRIYGISVALIAASLVAAAPILIYYSVTARGYILVSLFTILVLTLGFYLIRHRNLFAWILLIVFITLGFYTLPIMLYPFGILLTWLVMRVLLGDLGSEYPSLRNWLKYIITASFIAGLFTILCYLPIFLKNGVLNFFNGATVVNSLSLSVFLASFPARLNDLLNNWRFRTPPFIETILIAGLFISLFVHRAVSKVRVPLQAAVLLFLSLILLVQRPNSMPRIWLWLLPLCLIFSAAGFVGLFQWLARPLSAPAFRTALLGVVVLMILGGSLWNGWQISPKAGQPYPGREVEIIARYLKRPNCPR